MPDPTASPLVPLLLLVVIVALVALARARRWAAVCHGCAWRARALTLDGARRAGSAHAQGCGHSVELWRRGASSGPTTSRRDDTSAPT